MEAIFEALLTLLFEFVWVAVEEILGMIIEIVIDNIISGDFLSAFNRDSLKPADLDEIITLNLLSRKN